MSAAARILERLDGVRRTGQGRWLAKCPAHQDGSPSLSIRELDDGRVLLHDFGGCETDAVLSAIGLLLSDLFDKPIAEHIAPTHNRITDRDVLEVLDREILVAALILDDLVAKGGVPNADQHVRLTHCAARVGAARDLISPMRMPHAA